MTKAAFYDLLGIVEVDFEHDSAWSIHFESNSVVIKKLHSKASKPEPVKETYDLQTTGQLWIRKAPVDGATLIAMPTGTKVKSLSNPWVKVRYEKDGKIYEGWSSMKYLKTVR